MLAAYGEAPALLALVAAGTLAVTARPPVHMVLRWLLIIGGAGLIIVGTLALIIRPEEYWALPAIVRTLIALTLSAAAIWATARFSAGATWQAMCTLAAALFAVVAVEMVLVQGVKIFWERPRMRMLAETGAEFSPWWSPGYEDRDALTAQGVEASEFKSFPSGHSANAATLMMLTGFALLREEFRRYTTRLFWIGAAWAPRCPFPALDRGALPHRHRCRARGHVRRRPHHFRSRREGPRCPAPRASPAWRPPACARPTARARHPLGLQLVRSR